MNPLANQLKWLIGIRLVAITSVALSAFLFQLSTGTGGPEQLSTEGSGGFEFIYFLAGLTYLASLGYIILLRVLSGRLVLQAYIQFVGDLLLVTGLVSQSGGISSPFSMLYLIVISVAATLLRRRAALIVARLAWLLYASLLVGLYFSTPAVGSIRAAETGRLIYNLLVHALGFYAVARLTSYLAENVTRAERELVEKSRNLAELEMFHRNVIESISSGLVTTDLDGVIVSVNRAGREILGRSEDDLIGKRILELGLLDHQIWERLLRTSTEQGRIREEVRFLRGREVLYIGFSASRLVDEDGSQQGLILIFQNLTDWRQLQEEMQLKERMAAVGELAAGLAHEIGNPLAAISGSVQMLSRSAAADSSRSRLLDIVLQESKRLDRTIKGFLQYARPKDRSAVRFDVAKLLKENVELLRNSEEVNDNHELELRLEPESAMLTGDPDQISQIFWNLARNALRAMPAGGQLHIRGLLEEEHYQIFFEDSGQGMSDEEKVRLFHPFKTFSAGGTGIGMSIVYRIVEEHGGRISVESEEGEGTRVKVSLPALDPASIDPTPVEV